MPFASDSASAKVGTVTFPDVDKSPLYVAAIYDPSGEYDGASGPPPSEVVKEASVSMTKKGLAQTFGTVKRCRIVLEVGTHSPWVSRLFFWLLYLVYQLTIQPILRTKIRGSHAEALSL